jgi:hypothetical protein
MINEQERRVFLCKKLQRLGFASEHRIRLYGEEFELISNPIPDGTGFGIDGISQKSGSLRHVRIPLSLVRTIENELQAMEEAVLAV